MAGNRIKGITIEIGGDTTKLAKSLSDVDNKVKGTQSNLRDVNKLLKFDPKNTVLLQQKQQNLSTAIDGTKSRLEQLRTASAQAAKTAGNYDAWKKAYDPIQKKIEETNKKAKSLKEQLEKLKETGDVDTEEYKKLQTALKDTQNQAAALKKEAKEVSESFGNPISPEAYDALQREIIDTEQQLKNLEKQTKEFGSVGAQRVAAFGDKCVVAGEKVQAFGGKLEDVGKKVSVLSGMVAGLGLYAVKEAASFEDSMAGVQATLGITADATSDLNGKTVNTMESLEELARQLGKDTKYSAGEAADAINILAMAGYDTQKTFDALPNTLNLAAAGNMAISDSANIVTGVLAGFNMKAEKSGEVADKLAKLASSAKGDVAGFGAGLSTVASNASRTRQGIDEISTALGIFGNENIAGAEAGNMLSRILKNLYTPSATAKKELDKLGISAYDAEHKEKALSEVLAELNAKLSGLNNEAKNETLATIFDTAAISGANILLKNSGAAFDELKAKIQDSAGAAQQMADTQMNTLNGQITVLKSATSELAISFGKLLIPEIKTGVDKVQKFLDKLNNLDDQQRKTIVKIGAVVVAAGPALTILGKLTTGIGKVISVGGKALKMAPKIVSGAKAISAVIGGSMTASIAGVVAPALAVGAAIGLMMKKSKDAAKEKYALTDAEKALIAQIKEESEAYKAAVEAQEKNNKATLTEFENNEKLWAELQQITDANGKVKEGYEDRAQVITGLLSNALGDEIKLTDNIIQNYADLKDSIDQLIESKKAEAFLSGNYEAWQDAQQNIEESELQYLECMEKVNALIEERARKEKEYDAARNNYLTTGAWSDAWELQKVQDELDVLSSLYDEAADKLNDATGKYYGYMNTIQQYNALLEASASGNAEKIDAAINDIVYNFKTAETATDEMLREQVAQFEKSYDLMERAAKNRMPNVSKTHLDTLGNMLKKAREEMEKGGIKTADSFADGINSKQPAANTAGKALGDNASAGAGSVSLYNDGGNTADGYVEGILSRKGAAYDAGAELASATDKGMRVRALIKSPSRLAGREGAYWVQGWVNAIKAGKKDAAAVGAQLVGATLAPRSSAMLDFPELQRNMTVNLNAGTVNQQMAQIDSLSRGLERIYNRLNRMEVRLSNGALVGELSPGVDSTMGRAAKLKERGV
ncbi:MAG: phage tail tape measure protein [Clostridia bacterium]|nr:phage tail tape measure protein [Clostridia bacterium]